MEKIQEKHKFSEAILLHLANCVDFGFSYGAQKGSGISGKMFRDMIGSREKDFRDNITELKKNKFIEKKKNYDGSIAISLTDKGRLKALHIKFKKLNNKKELWDRRWRMVAFDIPEKCRKGRSALRYKIRLAGFYELQESLFLYPYDCEKEIAEFSKLFKLEKYIRFALIEFIDNQDEIEKIFKLN